MNESFNFPVLIIYTEVMWMYKCRIRGFLYLPLMKKLICCIAIVLLVFLYTECVQAQVIASGDVTDTDGNKCGTLKWSIDSEGTFTVTGKGPGATYRPGGENEYDRMCPWDEYRSLIRNVIFDCEFTGAASCTYKNGASINSWFVECVNLESYSDIPYGVTDMSAAFYKCYNLKRCGKIPDSVVVMQYTFSKCKSLVNPPELPTNLEDGLRAVYKGESVGIDTYALGLTFSGCINLKSTPSFENCNKIYSLVGTFTDCNNLVTIANLPSNINYLFNTFNNCNSVRGVFSSECVSVRIDGTPFLNFSNNNEYILFAKLKDADLFQIIKSQAGNNFRGYQWDDEFIIDFEPNAAFPLADRKLIMEYGVDYTNDIDLEYKEQISNGYYVKLPQVIGNLPIPKKAGLTFDGWYYDEQLTRKVFDGDVVNPSTYDLNRGEMTLYAKWVDKQSPAVYIYFLDEEWHNKPVTVEFDIYENIYGGLKKVELYQVLENGDKLFWDENIDDEKTRFEFGYTFGDVASKLYEGITYWKVKAEDLAGNIAFVEFQVKLDYTSPVIMTDSKYDDGQEIVYIDKESVQVWGEDSLSGPAILRINPSNAQNQFIDTEYTPYVTEEFKIKYTFPENKDIHGYVLYMEDKAGNIATRVIIRDKDILARIKRVISRSNYD